jgi:ABC-2 type transport system ATP-binding protein
LWHHLPAINSFELLAKIYNLTPKEYKTQLDHLTKTFEIEPFINTAVRGLSLGQRMRCEIVASLLHKPKILFFDEPTIDLDVTAKAIIWDLIKKQSYDEETTRTCVSRIVKSRVIWVKHHNRRFVPFKR